MIDTYAYIRAMVDIPGGLCLRRAGIKVKI